MVSPRLANLEVVFQAQFTNLRFVFCPGLAHLGVVFCLKLDITAMTTAMITPRLVELSSLAYPKGTKLELKLPTITL